MTEVLVPSFCLFGILDCIACPAKLGWDYGSNYETVRAESKADTLPVKVYYGA